MSYSTLQAVGFSYDARERKTLRATIRFFFPVSMCKVHERHTPHDAFDITLFHFAAKIWNHYTEGSPKRSSYIAECMQKHQNKFTNLFTILIYSSFALDSGSLKETDGCSQGFLSQEA